MESMRCPATGKRELGEANGCAAKRNRVVFGLSGKGRGDPIIERAISG